MSDDNHPFSGGFTPDQQAEGEEDAFVETSEKSWWERIREAFAGIAIGFVLIAGGIFLLFWNEGRAVVTAKSLAEGAGLVQEAQPDRLDATLQGKLVHVSAAVRLLGQPSDTEFGVSAPGLRLVRHVEMYQWKENKTSETQKRLGGGEETVTRYSYRRDWSDRPIRSDGFRQPGGHANPAMPIQGVTFRAPSAMLGAYAIQPDQLDGIGTTAPLRLDSRQLDAFSNRFGRRAQLVENRIFLGADPGSPQIGDLRISYSVATLDRASIVAAQSGNRLTPYRTEAGRDLFLKQEGDTPAAEMFRDAQRSNTILTWVLRAAGLAVLFIGFRMLFRIASVLADVVPLFGSIVAFGLGLVALALAIVVGALTISIAWFYYRPLVSVLILAGGAMVAGVLWYRGRSRRPAAAPA